MTKDEIIKALRDMAKYPTVTLPRDCNALRAAADLLAQPEQEYQRGYADAMGWKVQNHLEHLPPAQPEQDATMQSLKDLWREVCDNVGKQYFAQPPQRTWVGLTEEETDDIIANAIDKVDALIQTVDKLKEKNT